MILFLRLKSLAVLFVKTNNSFFALFGFTWLVFNNRFQGHKEKYTLKANI